MIVSKEGEAIVPSEEIISDDVGVVEVFNDVYANIVPYLKISNDHEFSTDFIDTGDNI